MAGVQILPQPRRPVLPWEANSPFDRSIGILSTELARLRPRTDRQNRELGWGESSSTPNSNRQLPRRTIWDSGIGSWELEIERWALGVGSWELRVGS